ncbi:hypothetical protein Leryth_011252 [Lithospermum erythrorhizon]|nr:hypothetical protein Leryth_011252 [Lithospermum erythrorhizon]
MIGILIITLKKTWPYKGPTKPKDGKLLQLDTFMEAFCFMQCCHHICRYPISSRAPYVLSWLNDMISAEDMMDPEWQYNNVKTPLQLTSASERDVDDHLHKKKPVLALAGDRDPFAQFQLYVPGMI